MKAKMSGIALILSLLSIACGLGGLATSHPPEQPTSRPTPYGGDGGKIAFLLSGYLYTINYDGTGQSGLLGPRDIKSFAWSPDGTKFAFLSTTKSGIWVGDFSDEISVMNADGSNVKPITQAMYAEGTPTWSPDGKQIAFTALQQLDREIFDLQQVDREIFTVKADETDIKDISNDPGTNDTRPAWSPDGTKILFFAGDQLHVINSDGSNDFNITDKTWPATDATNVREASWSPDSKRILYTYSKQVQPLSQIKIMDADGSNIRELTVADKLLVMDPVWAPNGQYIAFSKVNNGGVPNLFRINADGSNMVNLTNYTDSEWGQIFDITWSPDGKHIAFYTNRSKDRIFLVNLDDMHATQLAGELGDGVCFPAWRP